MLKDITELQRKIIKVCKGHSMQEIIHCFEVLKLEALLNNGKINGEEPTNIKTKKEFIKMLDEFRY